MSIFTTAFAKDAAERAIKTAAQTALSALGLNSVTLLSIDWVQLLSLSGGAALVSVLTSIISTRREDTISPASAAKPPE